MLRNVLLRSSIYFLVSARSYCSLISLAQKYSSQKESIFALATKRAAKEIIIIALVSIQLKNGDNDEDDNDNYWDYSFAR